MYRSTLVVVAALSTVVASKDLVAQSRDSQPIRACGLLSAAEVKRYLPWEAMYDRMAPEEESVGENGSSCSYPSVHIQVLPATSRLLQSVKDRGGLEKISGLGEEAYFHRNPTGFWEVYVKAGRHVVTVQTSSTSGSEAMKTGAVNLARALLAKLTR